MMVRRVSIVLLLCLVSLVPVASAASANVVMSQVYGGGGSGTAGTAYTNDYVELFNPSSVAVPIAGWSLQYGSSTGQFGSSSSNVYVFPAGTSVPAGGYLLVKLGSAGAAGAPVPADLTSTGLNMAAGSGKVALVNIGTALGCGATATPCALPESRIVDLVSYGAANNGEGGTAVNNGTGLNSSNGAVRKSDGCQDTDNNRDDFFVATTGSGLVPRNAASSTHTCGVSNLAPSINAPANPIATVDQDGAPFTVTLTGADDGGVYVWSATAGSGVASVNVTSGQGTPNVTYTVALQAGFFGQATFTASLSDSVNATATRPVNIAVTSSIPNDAPSIDGFANPVATVAQDAAPFNVSLSGLDDNGVFHWSATAGSGVSNVAVASGQGTANVVYSVTLNPGFSGTATFTALLSDNVNAPATSAVTITVTPAPPPPLDHIVISQIYGGGGNSGAAFQNDFIELYNPTTAAVDLGGWTVQYASATGTGLWQPQPLGGIMEPGQYYLISLATNGTAGSVLPTPNINGSLNMSGTNGKVALVRNGDALEGCPIGDPMLVDLVGYGTTANCREGATNAPTASNATSLFRKNGGFTDTNVNGSDFVSGTPNPRRTTPIVEIGPYVLSTDPRNNATTAPRDANITVNFTEAVDATGAWFNIDCAMTGLHNDATLGGGGSTWIIVPNVNFQPGEVCTVTIDKDAIHDQDFDDSGANTDTLTADYTWTFSVATGTAPAYAPEVHLTMGNPSAAETDLLTPNNYLMEKPELALSYNRDRGTPNWVSWHLDDTWVGTLARVDTFRADPAVPADWYRVLSIDYFGSGFDRGHMVPNADRDPATSMPINQATFLMTNMIPQAPDNNQGPWANMENYLRTLLPANELYIIAGGAGTGGTGSSGFTTTFADGNVTVPAQTWKVALVLPKDSGDDVHRVTAAARTIAVILPNTQGIRNVAWESYLTTVDQVEALTGYDFFANVGDAVENSIEAGINGVNPPGVDDQSFSVLEDEQRTFTLESASANGNPLTYAIVTGPSNGTLTGSGATQTYTPLPDFYGTDTFTFRVSDGTSTSNLGTMTITVLEVNDAPVITSVSGPTAQVPAGTATAIALTFVDNDTTDTHTATFTWGDGTSTTVSCDANGCAGSTAYATAGIYDVTIVVTDAAGAVAMTSFSSVIVYDTNAGHVTGGGWFSTASGKAHLNLNVKYLSGQSTPAGNTKFDVAGIAFQSTSYEWLVVSGATATWGGKGTVNGGGNYTFTATAVDGASDAFRIRIWDTVSNAVVYDTIADQPLGGGNITIHKAK